MDSNPNNINRENFLEEILEEWIKQRLKLTYKEHSNRLKLKWIRFNIYREQTTAETKKYKEWKGEFCETNSILFFIPMH